MTTVTPSTPKPPTAAASTPMPSKSGSSSSSVPTLRALPQFPDSVLRPGRLRWQQRLRAVAILTVLVAVALAAIVIVRRINTDDGQALRTSVVSTQSVSETYHAVAAIEPVTRAQIAFPVSGTVDAVNVAVGDTVAIGDVLATVATTSLEQDLRDAESTLASAQLTLNVAVSGQDPSTAGGNSLGGGSGGGIVRGAAFSGSGVQFSFAPLTRGTTTYEFLAVSDDERASARQAIVTAQSNVTAATNAAASARDSAVSLCAAVNVTVDPDDPGASVAAINANVGACQTALDQFVAAQTYVTTAQSVLTAAAAAYDTLLDTWAGELEDSASTTTTTPSTTPTTTPDSDDSTVPGATTSVPGDSPSMPSGSGSSGSRPSGSGSFPSGSSGGSGGGSTAEAREPTAAELIAYQADYDAAAQAVEAARQALAQATIVSPIEGTVTAVDLAVGQSVSAASDTQVVVVEGDGGYEATLSVSVEDIERIAVGQAAELVPDGGAAPETGEVVAISLVPDTSGSTVNYRVTVALTAAATDLTSGNIGDVGIVVASGDDVVAVPTSAVTPTANGYTVEVVDATGVVQTVRVQIGATGPEWTEIRGGVEAGQTIVIA
ncbi:MAG TPA: HlyD family efflux transporter periplasmic adaptor subunit, partial [Ilumatobacteraceae bacterium]|nr:HlyD family efflux transporter periplasmic adaptor subunit [Ilumatobacteraceae bacterium]